MANTNETGDLPFNEKNLLSLLDSWPNACIEENKADIIKLLEKMKNQPLKLDLSELITCLKLSYEDK